MSSFGTNTKKSAAVSCGAPLSVANWKMIPDPSPLASKYSAPVRRVVDDELLAIEAADRVRRGEEVVGGQHTGRELAEDQLPEVDRIVAVAEVGDRVDVDDAPAQGEQLVEQEDVVALAAGQRVVPIAAGEDVVAALAVEDVVAGVAVELVVAAVARQLVGAKSAEGVLDALELVDLVEADVGLCRLLVLQLQVHRGKLAEEVRRVRPFSAVEDVVA